MQRLDYNVLVPYLQPKHEYVLCICLTDFQKKLYQYYLDNFARAGQIGSDGKLEGGKKGGLFYDVQNLSRVWNHPYILAMAKTRADQKALDDEDEDDEEGSLKDFIDDGSGEEEDTTASEKEDEGSDDCIALDDGDGGAVSKKRSTRGQGNGEGLVKGLDEAKSEALASSRCWWDQFMEEGQSLESLELGSKMIILMDILKECESVGDKVLVFSQSLLSLDLIEDFLERADRANADRSRDDANEMYLGSWRHGRDYFRMDGSTAPDTRKKWCNYFNKVGVETSFLNFGF